ncbi:MAG: hypothetical protein P8O16_06925 [Algoriphagus sp.]|uniref:hypothetical protein n=1 Tax=Algoriphagus sp. TaxID=1872435 RepID=UPI00261439A2|nr:hypothetical protein [Algoriphagus sp.]MDG1276997.1 hypothetical protein [Algoriphagus sp.]
MRAALSRGTAIYKNGKTEKEKERFKLNLFRFTCDLIVREYQNDTPTEKRHLENIQQLITHSEGHREILEDDHLNFGRAQKILNLFLKYRWSLGTASTPPHFPVDRLIQLKMGIKSPLPWTSWTDESEYLKVISLAKSRASEEGFDSIAAYELWLYNRD